MAGRYLGVKIDRYAGKTVAGASRQPQSIRNGARSGSIPCETFVLSENTRLDQVAANYYGDPTYWWIIASASGIGWACQAPAGTVLKVPINIDQIMGY